MFTMLPWTWLLIIIVVTWKISLSTAEIRVVCYYTNWSVYRPGTAKFNPQNINPYLCTHLIYAFGGFTKENNFKPFDKYQDIEKGGYAKFTGLKTYNKNLKTMLAVGGWNEGSSRFSPMVANPERRKEFVKNSVKFLRQNHFDGLDLDWEYPSFRDGGKPRDKDNYATLVQELREEYDRESEKTGRPRLLLTMAVPAGIEYINKGYDVPRLMKYLDWMNILSYDYHSAFEPAVNHHSPLYSLEEESEYNYDADLNINHTINHYMEAGAEPNKLVLGIPTYGRSYTLFNPDAFEIGAPADGPGEMGDATRENGYLAYYEICEKIKEDDEWTVEQPNPKAMGPYAYKEDQWVGYDDENIVRKKSEFVAQRRLGGIMFWSIDNDDFRGACHGKPYPLIEAAKEALIAASGSTIDNVISPPEKHSKSKSRTRTRPGSKKASDDEEDAKPAQNSGGRQSADIPATRKRTRPKSHNKEEETQISNKRRLRVQKKQEEEEEDDDDEDEDDEDEVVSKKRRLIVHKENNNNRRKETKRRGTTTTSGPILSAQTPKYTTPEPPTTPDPGGDFKCEDEGFFPHPRDCKKYFWCLSSGPSELGIVAHQFTCPSGLYFNKAADSCDYTQNVLCKKKAKAASTTTTSTTPSASSSSTTKAAKLTKATKATTEATIRTSTSTTRRPPRITAATSRTTFVSRSTTPEYQEEYEYEDEDEDADDIEEEDGPLDSEEDPQVIKELIALIKKAGGIEELEKQLNIHDDGSISVTAPGSTTPPISKTLYERVLSRAAAAGRNTERPSFIKNSRGPQYDGKKSDDGSGGKRARPQYTAISRFRSSTEKSENEEEVEPETEKSADKQKFARKSNQPSYKTISRSRPSTTSEAEAEVDVTASSRSNAEDEAVTVPTHEYVTLKRKRPTTQEPTPKYVTIRGRTSSVSYEEDGNLAETTTPSNPSTLSNINKTSELSNNEYINTVEQQNITDTVEVSKILDEKVIPDEAANFGTEKIFKVQDETTQFAVNSQTNTESDSSSQRYRSSTISIDTSTTASPKVSDPISSRNVLRSRPFQKATDTTDNSHNSTNVTESTTKRTLNRFNFQETNERFKNSRRRLPNDKKEQDEDIEDDISNETDNPSESDKESAISRPKIRPRPFSPKRPTTEKSSTDSNYNLNKKEYTRTEHTNTEKSPTRRGSAKYDYHDGAVLSSDGVYYDDGSYDPQSDQKYYGRKFRPDIAAEISDLSSLTSVDISKPVESTTGSRRRISPRPQRISTTQEPVLNVEASEDSVKSSLRPLALQRKFIAGQEYGRNSKRTITSSTEEPSTTTASRIQKKSPSFARPQANTLSKTLTDSEATTVNLPKPKPRNNFSVLGRKRLDTNHENKTEEIAPESTDSELTVSDEPKPKNNFSVLGRTRLETNHENKTEEIAPESTDSELTVSDEPKPRNNFSVLGRKRLETNHENKTEEIAPESTDSELTVSDKPKPKNNFSVLGRKRLDTNHENKTEDISLESTESELTVSEKPKPRNNLASLARRRVDHHDNNTQETNSDDNSLVNPLIVEINSTNSEPKPRLRNNFAPLTRKRVVDNKQEDHTEETRSSSEKPVTRPNRKVIRRFRPTSPSTTSTVTTAATTVTESQENEINSEISQTTTTEEDDSKSDISTIPVIVAGDNDIKENITERGSSDNDEDVYRTSEEEEENIKLSETSIREKSEIRINALNDNSEKQRRRVVKKIRNEGKTSQTKINYLEDSAEKDTDLTRNITAVTEHAPVLRTRKIIRKLQTTTETTTTSEAPKGRTRKIIRRLRPTTTESTPRRFSTTQNALEDDYVNKPTKTKVYGAKRIRPAFIEKPKPTAEVKPSSEAPRFGFRSRQRINVTETEENDLPKPVIRRIGPQRRQRIKLTSTKETSEEDGDISSTETQSSEETPLSRRRLRLPTTARNTEDENVSSEDTQSEEEKPTIRRVIPQRRQRIKIYGDKNSASKIADDSTETEKNKPIIQRQRLNLFNRRTSAIPASEKDANISSVSTNTTESEEKDEVPASEQLAQKQNSTETTESNSLSSTTEVSGITTETQPEEEEDEEDDDDEEEEFTTVDTTTIDEALSSTASPTTEDETLSSTASTTDISSTASSTDASTKQTEEDDSAESEKPVETSTKSLRGRLNRVHKLSTTTQSTIVKENKFNIFSRFNARRRESQKDEQNETAEIVETGSELNNETNVETQNLTDTEAKNTTEHFNSTTTEDVIESTTVIEGTTLDLDDVTQETTIGDDLTTTEIPEDETEKPTTIRTTTTPFYYRAKLSRPPFKLQRNRATTEASKPASSTKEYSRSTGYSRYNSRNKYKSRFDKTTSTEATSKAILDEIVNTSEVAQNQTTESSNISSTLSTPSTPELQTPETLENNTSTEDPELSIGTTEIVATTDFVTYDNNSTSDNQTVSEEISSTLNISTLLEATSSNSSDSTETATLNSTNSIETTTLNLTEEIQNITDSILDAELLALIEQYEAERDIIAALELLNTTSSNQTEELNQTVFENKTTEETTKEENVTEIFNILERNTTEHENASSSTTEDTLTTTTTRKPFVPRRRTFTTPKAEPESNEDRFQEQLKSLIRTTPARPKYKPRGKPTERTLLNKQTTKRVTIAPPLGRNKLYLRSTTESTKPDNEDIQNVTENPEADDEEEYDDEDGDEEYEDDEEEEVVAKPLSSTERSVPSFNRSSKPYVPKRPSLRGSTEKPSSVSPRRFGGGKNNPVGKQANTPAPFGNAAAKNSRNKLFGNNSNKPRRVNTPYPGIVASSTTGTTASTAASTTTIATTIPETISTSSPEDNSIETTTESRSTTEMPELVTLYHIFSETESSTSPTTEYSSAEVTGTSADNKVERLIEVNRIVEVSLKEGKFKHNAMVESEVTLSPTLDRIGAINRVTVIKVVDPNSTEIISSLKDADKLRLNVTLPTNDVNKQQSLLNDIINAISSDLNTKAINISIINDLTLSNITTTTETSIETNLVSNGTKLEDSNLISANVEKAIVKEEDPNLIHIYSSGEVIDAIIKPHTQEEENLAKAQLQIDGKSVVNTFTPKPSLNSESSTIALEGLFQPDWNRLQREQSNNDEILQTQNANYVNIKVLEQDGSSRRLRINEEQPILPIRLLKQDEYTTSRAEVIEITPEMRSDIIKIAPIAISVGSMHPVAQHRQSDNTEHTTVVFPVKVSRK